MDGDAAMLGSRSSSASAGIADFVRLVSFDLSGTVHLRFTSYRISAWKRSIDGPIAMDKRISLITAIFSNRGVAEEFKRLSRDDAQAFVDVVDEVFLHSSVQVKWLADLASCRVDIRQPRTAAQEEVSEHTMQDM